MIRVLVFLFLLMPSVCFSIDYTMQLDRVRVVDLSRIVYSDILDRSFVFDPELIASADSVSINWNKLKKSEVEAMMVELLMMQGFKVDHLGGILIIRKSSSHDDGFLLYRPKFRSTQYLSDIVSKVAEIDPLGSRAMDAPPEFKAAVSKGVSVPGSAASQFDKGALDQLAYSCPPVKCEQIQRLLSDLDNPEAQVVLKAAIYEVGTSKGKGSAFQMAAKLLQGRLTLSAGAVVAGTGTASIQIASSGIDAVLAILDQDSRFKVLSRPMLRVRTGAQAKFSVGQQVPVLGAISQDRNGNNVQSVEYRQSGTIFTVQPDIRESVIDLNITQELSSFVATTTGVNNSPTLLQRMATSQISIKPGEVVVFAGLEEQKDDQAESNFFGFKIQSQKNSTSSEVLLFIEAVKI